MKYFIIMLKKLDYSHCRHWVLSLILYQAGMIYFILEDNWFEHPYFMTLATIVALLAIAYSAVGLSHCLIKDKHNKRKVDIYWKSEQLKRELNSLK